VFSVVPFFFTTKPTEVYAKFTKCFRCTSSLCSLCLLRALCGSLFFLPQSPRRFTQRSPRVFPNTASLCPLCLLCVLCGSLFFLPQSSRRFTQSSPRVSDVLLLCALCVFFVPSVVPYFFYHKAHQGFFDVLLLCALCVFFVHSVVPYFFTTKPTEVYTKFTQGLRCTSSLCSLCLLRALCGSLFFLPQSPRRFTQRSPKNSGEIWWIKSGLTFQGLKTMGVTLP
jgi:hypothetical protein